MLLSKQSRHYGINIMTYNFLLWETKALEQALAHFENATTRFSISTYVNDCRIFSKQNIGALNVILNWFLSEVNIMCFIKVLFTCLLIISNES